MLRLEWSTLDLYQLLTKRLANKSDTRTHYLTAICKSLLMEDATFGKLPAKNDPRVYEDGSDASWGANARKGKSYTWIPNHLQDGGGKIVPHSFLKLFSLAADYLAHIYCYRWICKMHYSKRPRIESMN